MHLRGGMITTRPGGPPFPRQAPGATEGDPAGEPGAGARQGPPAGGASLPRWFMFFGLAVPRGDFEEPECDSRGDLKVHQE